MGFLSSLFGGGKATQPRPAEPRAAGTDDGGDSAWERLRTMQRMGCPVALIEEDAATGEVAEIFEQVKAALQLPTVPNIDKVIAHSPQVLKATTHVLGELYLGSSLPKSVVSMLLYAISLERGCQYCGSFHRLTCRSVGVDEVTLEALGNDMGSVAPERVQAIVAFGLKAATASDALASEDFERLRELGISEAEIVEIVGIAAMGMYLNVLADTLKVEVDPMIQQGLAA